MNKIFPALVVIALLQIASAEQDSSIKRSIDGTLIRVAVDPAGSASVYGLEELLPEGLTPSNISDEGAWDAGNRKVKWYFLDNEQRTVSYNVTGDVGAYRLTGEGSFDGFNIATAGDEELIIGAAPSGFQLPELPEINITNLSGKFQNVTQTGVAPIDDLTGFLINISPFLLLIIGLIIFFLAGFAKIIAIVLIILAIIRIAWMLFFGG